LFDHNNIFPLFVPNEQEKTKTKQRILNNNITDIF